MAADFLANLRLNVEQPKQAARELAAAFEREAQRIRQVGRSAGTPRQLEAFGEEVGRFRTESRAYNAELPPDIRGRANQKLNLIIGRLERSLNAIAREFEGYAGGKDPARARKAIDRGLERGERAARKEAEAAEKAAGSAERHAREEAERANRRDSKRAQQADERAARAKEREAERAEKRAQREAARDTAREQAHAERQAALDDPEEQRRRRLETQRGQLAELGLPFVEGEDDTARQARILAAQRIRTEKARLEELRTTLAAEEITAAAAREEAGGEESIVVLQAKRKLLEQQLNQAVNQRAKAEYEAAVAQGVLPRGSLIQRAQAAIHERQTGNFRPETSFPTGRQVIASRFLTTAGFAISGALTYGAVTQIRELVRESEELERVLHLVQAQFEASDQAGQFPRARAGILEIARNTGQASDEVATVFFQFKGAFQSTTRAIEETNAAIQLSRVSGLDLNEVVDSLTATALTFGVTIDDIGDKALGLQERTGVLARQTITFVADIAPVAKEAGASMEQVAALGAVAQQVSGRSGSALAEAFGRIIPSLQEVSTEILNVYTSIPSLSKNVPKIEDAIVSGKTFDVFEQLVRDYNGLSQSEQNYIVTLLGGRREAQALIPVLQNSSKLVREWDRTTSDAGKQSKYFADLQDTLSQSLDRLQQRFTQLGDVLFRAGVSDFLSGLADAAGLALGALSRLLELITTLNKATGGWGLRLAGMLATVRLLSAAWRGLGRVVTPGVPGALAAPGAVGGIVPPGPGRPGQFYNTLNTFGAGAGAAIGGVSQRLAQTRLGGAAARGLGALGFTPGTFAVTAGLVGLDLYFGQRAQMQQAEADLRQKFEQQSKEQLKKIAQGHSDFWAKVGSEIFGHDLPEEIAGQELRSRGAAPAVERLEVAQEDLDGAAQDFLDKHKDEFLKFRAEHFTGGKAGEKYIVQDKDLDIDRLIDEAKKGDKYATQAVKFLADLMGEDGDLAGKIDLWLRDRGGQGPAGNAITASVESIDEARARYEAGVTSSAHFLSRLDREITNLERLRAKGDTDKDRALALAKFQKEKAAFFDEQLRGAIDLATQFREAAGGPTATPDARIAGLQRIVQSGNLSPEGETKAALDALQAYREKFQQELDGLENPDERFARQAQGFKVPDWIREALIAGQLDLSVRWNKYADRLAKQLDETGHEIGQQVAAFMVEGSKTVAEAGLAFIDAQIAELEKAISGGRLSRGDYESAQQRIAKLRAIRDDFASDAGNIQVTDTGDTGGETPEERQQRVRDARDRRREKALARIDLAKSATQDPQQIAYLELQAAQQELAYAQKDGDELKILQAKAKLNQATQGVYEANQAARRAYLEYVRASLEGDPAAAIAIERQIAQDALANAEGEVEKWEAMARLVDLERRAIDVALSYFQAQSNLAKAIAQAAGDDIAVAEGELRDAQAELDALRRKGYAENSPDVVNALANVVTQRANVRDTKFNERHEQLEYLHELGKITTQELIASLKALMQFPDITEDMRRELELEIHRLRGELSRDFQFNLPTELGLPTLYEARRLSQGGGPAGYNDNRHIVIQITANNSIHAEKALELVVDTLSAPSRYGTRPRLY